MQIYRKLFMVKFILYYMYDNVVNLRSIYSPVTIITEDNINCQLCHKIEQQSIFLDRAFRIPHSMKYGNTDYINYRG